MVVDDHSPVMIPAWLNRTINIVTGCVFGGKLTALRYPEKELVSVEAARVYHEPAWPLAQSSEHIASAGARAANLLEIDDVIGKRIVSTRLRGNVTVREENAAAALEVMSRFALDPRWLVYLPPTISPCDTSGLPSLLELPTEVFTYFCNNGVSEVVGEEKHIGPRAVVVAGQNAAAIERRFGITGEGIGACYTRTCYTRTCYTRTGRRFFEDGALEVQFLKCVRTGIADTSLWADQGTDWVVLDSELMPWSLKAQELLREQYAAVGVAARTGLSAAETLLQRKMARGIDAGDALIKVRERLNLAHLHSGS